MILAGLLGAVVSGLLGYLPPPSQSWLRLSDDQAYILVMVVPGNRPYDCGGIVRFGPWTLGRYADLFAHSGVYRVVDGVCVLPLVGYADKYDVIDADNFSKLAIIRPLNYRRSLPRSQVLCELFSDFQPFRQIRYEEIMTMPEWLLHIQPTDWQLSWESWVRRPSFVDQKFYLHTLEAWFPGDIQLHQPSDSYVFSMNDGSILSEQHYLRSVFYKTGALVAGVIILGTGCLVWWLWPRWRRRNQAAE